MLVGIARVFEIKHVLAVVLPVAGSLEDLFRSHDRRRDLFVARFIQLGAQVALQFLKNDHAIVVPKRSAGGDLVEGEQIELLADVAMIPALVLALALFALVVHTFNYTTAPARFRR